MRVLYVTGHGKGGSNVSLIHSINGLCKYGLTCKIIVPDYETMTFFANAGFSSQVIPYGADYWPFLRNFKDYLFFIPRVLFYFVQNRLALIKLKKEVSIFHPDIIHSNISTLQLGWKVSKKMNIPHLWHIREYNTKDFGYIPVPSELSLHKKLESSNTIAISGCIQQYYNLCGDEHKIIYNGILRKEQTLVANAKEDYFLYVGGLSKGKGVDFLISAFIEFLKFNPQAKLLLAGCGSKSFVDSLQKEISFYEAENNIIFLGRRDDVYTLMSKALALIVPSLSEAFGRITAEAMMNRCLVIGNNCAGTKEQFDKGVEPIGKDIGLRYNNRTELINQLNAVFRHPSQFQGMIDDAFSVSVSLYTEEKNAGDIYKFYKEIAE